MVELASHKNLQILYFKNKHYAKSPNGFLSAFAYYQPILYNAFLFFFSFFFLLAPKRGQKSIYDLVSFHLPLPVPFLDMSLNSFLF